MKGELGGRILTKFVRLKVKTYSNSIGHCSKDKKAKDTKMCYKKKTYS